MQPLRDGIQSGDAILRLAEAGMIRTATPFAPDQVQPASLDLRLGRRVFSDSLQRMKDPWGREIFWIGGGSAEWSGGEDSDFRAVRDGYVSVTPLHLDVTAHARLEDAASWWRSL